MKSDINLLYKRKSNTYSNKKLAAIALLLVVFAVGLYAGITLPSSALKVAKIESAEIENQLTSSSANQQDLTEKTLQEATLGTKLTELTTLNDTKADVLKYIEAIESSQPAVIKMKNVTIHLDSIELIGEADSDKTIALFCLRLREQNIFKDVFLTNSFTSINEGITTFIIEITLPSPLDSTNIIKDIEKLDDVTTVTVSASPTATTENGEEVGQK